MAPGKHQLSSRLAYQSGPTPAFLRQLQRQVGGRVDDDEEDEEPSYENGGGDAEWEQIDSSRPAIPRRPPIPSRPEGDPNGDASESEDSGDEAPTVVVLKEGKHLTSLEATNEKRKAKGLAPLPPSDAPDKLDDTPTAPSDSAKKKKTPPPSLSYSSNSSVTVGTRKPAKRKAIGEAADADSKPGSSKEPSKAPKKKAKVKKESKSLVSFGDD